MPAPPRSVWQVLFNGLVLVLIAAIVLAALFVARRNLKARRADARGATRLVTLLLAGYAICWVLAAHHVPDVSREIASFGQFYGSALFPLAILWVVYLALEPYVRRFWPDGILGWTRLTSGYVRDPRVGRDVLIGCVVPIWLGIVQASFDLVPPMFGYATSVPDFGSAVGALVGTPTAIAMLFDHIVNGLFITMMAALAYVILRLAFRRTVLAVTAAAGLLAIVQTPGVLASDPWWIDALFQACLVAVLITIVVRFGLLVTIIVDVLGNLLFAFPLSPSISHWTASASNLAVAVVVGLTLFGFYASRAGQPLLGRLMETPDR
jgi:eukaryotic-like serine/threonine-protein kinase